MQAYYVPRSNPDGVAVTFACINRSQVRPASCLSYQQTLILCLQLETFEKREFDGNNWESFFVLSNIKEFSNKT